MGSMRFNSDKFNVYLILDSTKGVKTLKSNVAKNKNLGCRKKERVGSISLQDMMSHVKVLRNQNCVFFGSNTTKC